MRHALIIAGGSGTRLWPMSTKEQPKQLIPFIEGRSLLQVAIDRLKGLLPEANIHVCAGEGIRDAILEKLPGMTEERFIAEPMGRDTLNAVALGTGVLGKEDPDAVVAVFTADHIITPVDEFQAIVRQGFELAEHTVSTLVTFGIAPTGPATGYGYLQLGDAIMDGPGTGRVVKQFKEKPNLPTARIYHLDGPEHYLWNSGMFVWKADTLLGCVQKYAPDNYAGIRDVLDAWGTEAQTETLHRVYPTLEKISVDYAVMEPAASDPDVRVAAVPMPLTWLDVGSWPSFGETCEKDASGNAASGCQSLMMNTQRTLAVSDDPAHLITTIGVEDLIIVRTAKATLVCKASDAEAIKKLHARVGEQLGGSYL